MTLERDEATAARMTDHTLWARPFLIEDPDMETEFGTPDEEISGEIVGDGVLFPQGDIVIHWRDCLGAFTEHVQPDPTARDGKPGANISALSLRYPDYIVHEDDEAEYAAKEPWPHVFQMHRKEDVSQTSGTGIVADGCVFPDGTTVACWRTGTRSIELWNTYEECDRIHGHGGLTFQVFKGQDPAVAELAEQVAPELHKIYDKHAVTD